MYFIMSKLVIRLIRLKPNYYFTILLITNYYFRLELNAVGVMENRQFPQYSVITVKETRNGN